MLEAKYTLHSVAFRGKQRDGADDVVQARAQPAARHDPNRGHRGVEMQPVMRQSTFKAAYRSAENKEIFETRQNIKTCVYRLFGF